MKLTGAWNLCLELEKDHTDPATNKRRASRLPNQISAVGAYQRKCGIGL